LNWSRVWGGVFSSRSKSLSALFVVAPLITHAGDDGMPKSRSKSASQLVIADSPVSVEALGSVSFAVTPNSRMETPQPLPSGHQIFSLVGETSSEFARLEHILDTVIWKLAGTEPALTACVTAQLIGIRPRCLTITALCVFYELPNAIIKKIATFSGRTSPVSDARNRLIHDPWFLQEKNSGSLQFRAMPKEQRIYGYVAVSQDDIKSLLAKVKQAISDAERLRDSIFAALPTSDEMPI
jgi:hypothetical protein